MAALTKAMLAALLIERLNIDKQEATEIVNAFFDLMCNTLEGEQAVKLPGFGTFQLRDKRARPGRNLRTGETVLITSRRIATFRASQKLKNLLLSKV